uniref:Globin family profile domain-containing protein n=1 Tax=Parascaris univalens TaxID=6257 RepID=A0A915B0X9_PARUN
MPPTILKVTSRSPMSRKRYSLPQVSVSFADDPSTSTVIFEDQIIEEDGEGCQHEHAKERDKSVSLKPSEHAPSLELRKSVEHPRSPNLSQFREERTDEERRKSGQLQLRRQSTMQFVQSVSGRRAATTLLPLTPAQIHLVRSLWRQVYVTKGPTVIGSALFHRLFFKSLKTKELFRNCPLPPQFQNHDSFFKAHCKATAELIDQVVENLDNLEAVNEELLRTGAVHTQISGGQFSGKLWNLVAETFIDCTLEWGDKRCRSETVRKAWALIVAFLSEKLKEGHA